VVPPSVTGVCPAPLLPFLLCFFSRWSSALRGQTRSVSRSPFPGFFRLPFFFSSSNSRPPLSLGVFVRKRLDCVALCFFSQPPFTILLSRLDPLAHSLLGPRTEGSPSSSFPPTPFSCRLAPTPSLSFSLIPFVAFPFPNPYFFPGRTPFKKAPVMAFLPSPPPLKPLQMPNEEIWRPQRTVFPNSPLPFLSLAFSLLVHLLPFSGPKFVLECFFHSRRFSTRDSNP